MTGAKATRHGPRWNGKNILSIENNEKVETAEEAGEKKTKQKDPKEEAGRVKKETEIKKLTHTKRPYTKERESEYRASQDSKRNKRDIERKDRR